VQLGPLFERFIQVSPIPVMDRALLERALDPRQLDQLFHDTAQTQRTRELLFSTLVKLLFAVVSKVHPSVRSASLDSLDEVMTSLTAVSAKLQGIEPGVCRGFVLYAHDRLEPILSHLDTGTLPPPVPGYRARIFDGNHLAGTEPRPAPTRTTGATPRPGPALVVLDPATMLVRDVVPCEDADAQERTLIEAVLERVAEGDFGIADRNFCCSRFVFGMVARRGRFLVRQHKATLRWEETREWTDLGRIDTGVVSEQTIRVTDIAERDGVLRDEPGQAQTMTLRRLRLVRDQPTEDGETELVLLSDGPAAQADGRWLATIDRQRWTVEHVFQTRTEALRCEIDTMAYPQAALFGFCTALVAYNAVAAVRAALRAAHGVEHVEKAVSTSHVAGEIARTSEGMMIALPPQEWAIFRTVSMVEFAEFLQAAAELAWLSKYPLSHRGPKKPRPKRASGKRNHHVATARLLDQKNRHNR
jgi:Transposase DDE domain